jgi:hypothetical protein
MHLDVDAPRCTALLAAARAGQPAFAGLHCALPGVPRVAPGQQTAERGSYEAPCSDIAAGTGNRTGQQCLRWYVEGESGVGESNRQARHVPACRRRIHLLELLSGAQSQSRRCRAQSQRARLLRHGDGESDRAEFR